MPNLWMIVSGLAVAATVSTSVYYFYPKQPPNPATPNAAGPLFPWADMGKSAVPGGNPLLTANIGQFRLWLPGSCGVELFGDADPEPYLVNSCVHSTVEQVALFTGVTLTRADVLDPRVKAHWRDVTKVK